MEGHSSSCLISAESNGAVLAGKCCAGEPSLSLTLPGSLLHPALNSVQTVPPKEVSLLEFRVSGLRGARACQDLEGPWGAWPPGAAALTWLPSGPWAHQPQPCLASGLCSGESEMCYLLVIEKRTKCLILTSDRQICCGEVWLEYTHTPI